MADTRPPEPLAILPADLSPGDVRCADFDFSPFNLHLIRSSSHPLFDVAYQKLWDEFGDHGAMEQRDVIVSRLKWNPAEPIGGLSLLYRIIGVTSGQRMVAVRDCTAIRHADLPDQVTTHLSHVLIDPDSRGTGLAGWLRALPVQIARRCHAAAGGSAAAAITLVAEMEPPDSRDEANKRRLHSYAKAGFLKIDPAVVRYYQPDFRDPADIDSAGGAKPLPFQLVIRRVGREQERTIDAAEVKRLVRSLYGMYSMSFRPDDMRLTYATLDRYPPDDQVIGLISPLE